MTCILPLQIYKVLYNRKTAKASEIAKELRISRQLASYHLHGFYRDGLVRKSKDRFSASVPLDQLLESLF